MEPQALSQTSRTILKAIAKGHTYEQILVQELAWTYHDIFQAAAEAIEVADRQVGGEGYETRMAKIQAEHPRAYQPWNEEEDARLTELFQKHVSVTDIAKTLQRQPGAIRSRLSKLNLVTT
jgi:hypothetical protein